MKKRIISCRDVSKWYGEVIGLNNFNLEIGPGITGIVGPNGAGKSTFFKLITGMIKQNTGEITVLGEKPWGNTHTLSKIGFCPDYDNLADDMTGRGFLELSGGLHGMSGSLLEERIDEVGEIVGMTDALDRKIHGYSRGMRQRMKIAASILHEPPLLLLDEPLSGTDPISRKAIIDLIQTLHEKYHHNIIVSSHVLFEVERMTNNVVLIYRGRAVASGKISEIRNLIDQHPHNIVVETDNAVLLSQKLLERDYVVSVHLNEKRDTVRIQVVRPESFFNDIPVIVAELKCNVKRMYSLDDNLEAVFRYLVSG